LLRNAKQLTRDVFCNVIEEKTLPASGQRASHLTSAFGNDSKLKSEDTQRALNDVTPEARTAVIEVLNNLY